MVVVVVHKPETSLFDRNKKRKFDSSSVNTSEVNDRTEMLHRLQITRRVKNK